VSNKTAPVRRWSRSGAAGTTRGRLARFGYQPITSGSPPLVNFAQIRLTKRGTIFGIHDQKGGRTWFGVRTVSPRKDQSCRVEPLFRLLHPLSLASCALRLFQLTPSHTEEALALVASAFTTVGSIAVASIVVQPYAVEWRWGSELLRSVLVPPELTELIAADTIPTLPASRALVAVIERSLTAAPIAANGAGVSLPKWIVRAMLFGR
jgi:hypothetical protein